MSINYHSSVLFVKDIKVSRRFYESVLGQEIGMDLGLNIGFKSGFALWQADHALGVIHGKYNSNYAESPVEQFELYFECPEIEEAYETLRKSGIEFVHELVEQPWRQLVFRIYDPDRYIVEIAEPMDAAVTRLFKSGMSIHEVAEQTAMPEEALKAIHDGIK